MKLVEEREGVGQLRYRGELVGPVSYALSRFQALTKAGLPVPGLDRVEGHLALGPLSSMFDPAADARLSLELEDGRTLHLTLVDNEGNVLAEGHGPGKCGCC